MMTNMLDLLLATGRTPPLLGVCLCASDNAGLFVEEQIAALSSASDKMRWRFLSDCNSSG